MLICRTQIIRNTENIVQGKNDLVVAILVVVLGFMQDVMISKDLQNTCLKSDHCKKRF